MRQTPTIPPAEITRQLALCDQIHALLDQTPGQKLAFVDTYGCQQNEADSERLRGYLARMGYAFSDTEEGADLVLVNTCAIREHAEHRVFGNVGALSHTKRRHPGQVICVCGCMARQEHVAQRLRQSFPYVDLVFGPQLLWQFPQLLLEKLTTGKRVFATQDVPGAVAEGILTGKNLLFGGSLARTEATGYGCVYFAMNMLKDRNLSLEGKECCVSGAGNVAQYCCEKLYQIGAKPVTVSDSRGMVYDKDGIDVELLKQVKQVEHASLTRYAEQRKSAKYVAVADYKEGRHAVWDVPCFAAFPCATQNELNEADAKALIANGCKCVCEGANMPSTLEAIKLYQKNGVFYGPAKAANAGGVSVSQLEMAQNAGMVHWTFEEVDGRLKGIMKNIYTRASETAKEYGEPDNLLMGANVSAFREVADAMIAQGDY